MSRHSDTDTAATTGKGATARLSSTSNLVSFPAAHAPRLLPPPRRTPRPPRRITAVVELDDHKRYAAEQSAPVVLQVRVATGRIRAGDLVLCRTARGSYAMIYAIGSADERGAVEFDEADVARFEITSAVGRIASFIEGGEG